MLILLIGAKGGVGVTSLARRLAQDKHGVGLDLSDGRLAALLDRRVWMLDQTFSTQARQQAAVEEVVANRYTLLWTPACRLAGDGVWAFVRAVANRALVVADGGIGPPSGIDEQADAIIVVSADNPVARYHAERLMETFPRAEVMTLDLSRSRNETRDAARALSSRLNLS